MPTSPAANLLGAFGLLITDEMDAALAGVNGIGSSSQAALLSIDTYQSCSIDQLRAALGLSHAAAVRCVAALVESGWVDKGRADDRRTAVLALTPEGRRLQRRLQEARAKALRSIGAGLSSSEVRQLESLMRKMLRSATRDQAHGMRLCRLCECGPCLAADCPVESKLRAGV